MKKILFITVSIALIIAMAVTFVGCNFNDELGKLQRAVQGSIESTNSLDKASASDLESDNISLYVQEYEAEVMLSANAFAISSEEQTIGQKVMAVIDCLDYVKAQQTILDQDVESIKAQFATFKVNVKEFRKSGLTLDEEEKIAVIEYIDEVKAQKDAITATIGKVYLAIREARQSYNIASIDEALVALTEVCSQMDTRVAGVARVNEILTEVNALLNEKLNPTI